MSYSLKEDDIEILIDKFATVPPDEFTQKEIDCIHELTRFAHKQNEY